MIFGLKGMPIIAVLHFSFQLYVVFLFKKWQNTALHCRLVVYYMYQINNWFFMFVRWSIYILDLIVIFMFPWNWCQQRWEKKQDHLPSKWKSTGHDRKKKKGKQINKCRWKSPQCRMMHAQLFKELLLATGTRSNVYSLRSEILKYFQMKGVSCKEGDYGASHFLCYHGTCE